MAHGHVLLLVSIDSYNNLVGNPLSVSYGASHFYLLLGGTKAK